MYLNIFSLLSLPLPLFPYFSILSHPFLLLHLCSYYLFIPFARFLPPTLSSFFYSFPFLYMPLLFSTFLLGAKLFNLTICCLFYKKSHLIQILVSLVVRISACHVEGPGSIPGRGEKFLLGPSLQKEKYK